MTWASRPEESRKKRVCKGVIGTFTRWIQQTVSRCYCFHLFRLCRRLRYWSSVFPGKSGWSVESRL